LTCDVSGRLDTEQQPVPRLSFVVVAHREQGHLERLAASILDQGSPDVELVAIDDASRDHGPALLDELARRDERVRVRHLRARVGLAKGRNLALELVAGDYVWFVRATDIVPPGSISAVLRALEDTQPDVLLVQHSHANAVRDRRPGPQRKLLASVAEAGVVSLDRRPDLAALAPQEWNKVFRREFLVELGVRFRSGGHGELAVTWPALLAARRIAALEAEGYIHEEPPNAVRDSWVKGSPFDVFDQYEAVYAFADSLAGLGERRRLLLPAMLRHQLYLLDFVPPEQRRAFFRRMSESYRRHRGDERVSARGPARLRERLVERDAYATFRLLKTSARLSRRVRRARREARPSLGHLRRRVLGVARPGDLERYYRSRLQEPVDPSLAVFAAYWYRGYFCNPRAIYEKAREMVTGMRGVWVVDQDSAGAMPPGVDYVVAGTREYFDVIARAGYLVNNVNFPNHLVKREGTTHVMTHHGTPVKRMGFDLLDTPGAESRLNFSALLRRCRRWDYSVAQNAFTTVEWERAFPARYESLEVGYPRNDVLANATEEEVRRIRDELGLRPGQHVVLYAPTHREYQEGYVPMLDLAAVADGLGSDYVVMARLHYLYDTEPHLRDLHAEGRVRDVAQYPSVEDLCLAADALVTDYSSIMFDYAVLDRPIVIHAPDWEEYRARRGVYFDLLAEAPGTVTRTEQELIEAFQTGVVWGEDARRMRASFRARFCSLDDGRAAERVVRRVWLGDRDAARQPVDAVVQ
jgi:CDP-glycerol glycerophosphotransferase